MITAPTSILSNGYKLGPSRTYQIVTRDCSIGEQEEIQLILDQGREKKVEISFYPKARERRKKKRLALRYVSYPLDSLEDKLPPPTSALDAGTAALL